jgi:hypothetical protein
VFELGSAVVRGCDAPVAAASVAAAELSTPGLAEVEVLGVSFEPEPQPTVSDNASAAIVRSANALVFNILMSLQDSLQITTVNLTLMYGNGQ